MKFLRFLLFPFAIIYDVVTSIRNFFFEVGFFKQTSFKIPIIVVGNLSVGGTGKTPQIEYLIRLLKDGFKTAVLSRGYKRKTEGFVLLNSTHSAEDVGDEPLQYYEKFNTIDVAVDANRVAGITKLITDNAPEVILLDDAYQHRKVKGSFYILLTKYDDLFTDDFLLPTGNLRESSSGAKRADVILVTKCPVNLTESSKNSIKQKLKKFHKKVFFTTISYDVQTAGSESILVNDLKDYDVLLITGIANPTPLLSFLTEKNVNFKHLKFPDHHHFTDNEIEIIKKEYTNLKSSKKLILTTEKDYVRLENRVEALSFLGIQTSFLEEQEVFNSILKNHIQ
ncbi:tetraacyldisaccharide 4'-kinase [Polaribacter sp. R2A056_3_33]|uniref:tetraacyldisaccharide 4'-kinase n=1 Tax=Polaribacter sp. R2A056_3_33 TaxID=2745563 RepID=UPI001C4F7D24|nr:tetraacyldisaccharide 4'-kinase [Polaribacter sp. R2A056_3_33]QXP69700.1 tetraacyldisaccharide 4'-kinase [Polaribacter sp. R2A056_3_33]